IVGQQPRLHRPATSQGYPLSFEVLDHGNNRVGIDNEMRREVDVNVAHRHHLTGTLKATLCLYIGKRSVPREIDLASGECFYQRTVVRVDHPVEFDAMAKKKRLESPKYADLTRRCRPTKPHHDFLPIDVDPDTLRSVAAAAAFMEICAARFDA